MEHYILMADVKLPGNGETTTLHQNVKNVIGVINKLHKKNFITPLDIVIPGEFQGITNTLQGSLEMMFDIEECIIENNLDFKLKYVLYQDTIATVKSRQDAYERLGFGLIEARDRLSAIKKTDSRFLINLNDDKLGLLLNNLFMIYEDYVDSWKVSEFDFVKAFLNNMTYKEVAAMFKINISSGWRRERNLKMKQYYTIKEVILSSI